jgi:hypothetical protein
MASVCTLFPLYRNRMVQWNSYSPNHGTNLDPISVLPFLVGNQYGILFYSISNSVYSTPRSNKNVFNHKIPDLRTFSLFSVIITNP